MAVLIDTRTGPILQADGAGDQPLRQGRVGQLIVSDGPARFFEAASRGMLFSGGMTLTSINNATFTTATLGATATPILGVWNPLGSGKNLAILQARVNGIITAATCTGPGALMWATSLNNAGLTLGSNPLNRGTLNATGSVAKDMSGIALTGLTNNLVVRDASMLGAGPNTNFSFVGTAVGTVPPEMPTIDHVDGAYIVPPGGVLALLATGTPVAISAAASITWEEIPIIS